MSIAHFIDFKPTGRVAEFASWRSEGKAQNWNFTSCRDKSTQCETDNDTKNS